jgi:hypothetical protein
MTWPCADQISVALTIFLPENAISTARDCGQATPLFVKGFPDDYGNREMV